jgi:hypothetical protein
VTVRISCRREVSTRGATLAFAKSVSDGQALKFIRKSSTEDQELRDLRNLSVLIQVVYDERLIPAVERYTCHCHCRTYPQIACFGLDIFKKRRVPAVAFVRVF